MLRTFVSSDHPSRDPADHANQDRRRRGKHPRGNAPAKPGTR